MSSILSYNTFNLLNKKSACRAISPEMGTRAAHLTAQLADLLGLCQQVHGPEVGGGGRGGSRGEYPRSGHSQDMSVEQHSTQNSLLQGQRPSMHME